MHPFKTLARWWRRYVREEWICSICGRVWDWDTRRTCYHRNRSGLKGRYNIATHRDRTHIKR